MPADGDLNVERELFNEKVKRLDDKIEQTERYLLERCAKIEAQAVASEKLLVQAQESAKLAVTIANDASKIRFESVNEFNTRMSQMAANFFTIPAFEQFKGSVEGTLKGITSRLDTREGQAAGVKMTGGMVMGAVALIAGLLTIGAFIFASRSTSPPQVIYTVPSPTTVVTPK